MDRATLVKILRRHQASGHHRILGLPGAKMETQCYCGEFAVSPTQHLADKILEALEGTEKVPMTAEEYLAASDSIGD